MAHGTIKLAILRSRPNDVDHYLQLLLLHENTAALHGPLPASLARLQPFALAPLVIRTLARVKAEEGRP